MLAIGTDMLQEMSLRSAWRSLTARQVAKRAGLTTGSFYNYWDTQEHFVAELVDHLLDPDALDRDLVSPEMTDALIALAALAAGPDQAAVHRATARWVEAGRQHLVRLTTDARFVAESRLAGCFHDDAVTDQLARTHQAQRRAYGRLAEAYLAGRGRRPVDPFSIIDVGEAVAALTRGYSSLQHADPARTATAERFAQALVHTLEALSCPLGAASAPG
jgi:AcrR family transcriptional regulator